MESKSNTNPLNLSYSPELNRELIVKFFLCFARAEYSLKRAGYVRGDEHRVDADWDKFASAMQHRFNPNASKELSSAVKYLLGNPPKKQILKDSALDWANSGCGSNNDLTCLLVLVRRVRNNLFHGGKFPLRPIPEVSRNETLLHHSLVILEAALQLSPDVMNFFPED
jgi:hypothetical protein